MVTWNTDGCSHCQLNKNLIKSVYHCITIYQCVQCLCTPLPVLVLLHFCLFLLLCVRQPPSMFQWAENCSKRRFCCTFGGVCRVPTPINWYNHNNEIVYSLSLICQPDIRGHEPDEAPHHQHHNEIVQFCKQAGKRGEKKTPPKKKKKLRTDSDTSVGNTCINAQSTGRICCTGLHFVILSIPAISITIRT